MVYMTTTHLADMNTYRVKLLVREFCYEYVTIVARSIFHAIAEMYVMDRDANIVYIEEVK